MTMTELLVSPVIGVIVEKLADPLLEKLGDLWGFKETVENLRLTLPMVQALLDDAEEQQASNAAVRIWLSKFKEVAYDAQDLLLLLSDENCLRNISYANKAKVMVQALEVATDKGLAMNLMSKASAGHGERRKRETSSFIVESEVCGREVEKEEMIKLLLSCEATQGGEAACVPIVGMGGIGKTTFAQLVYNSQRVQKYFDVKVWVFVSDHFDVRKIMKTVIESLTRDKCRYSNLDALHSEASSLLRNKRYLIVLDDVWTEDQEDWDELRPLFRGGIDGSKVLITTRSKRVATATNYPTFPFHLKELSEDACWTLFKQRAFRRGEEELHKNLLPIGQQIVRKCGGVALAAKTLGSLMRFKRDTQEWEFVRDSELWSLDDEREGGILRALRLSYSHLPLLLKRCFSFCSIFPRHYEFKKEKLIHLWMAIRLIQSRRPASPEDVGSDYFNDLLWMSFFKEAEESESEVVTGYKMHDVVYDLVKSIASSEYAILEQGSTTPINFREILHSSVLCGFRSSSIPVELYEASHLRTLLLLSDGNLKAVPAELYSRLKNLLVLDMSGSGLMSLEGSVSALSRLKYLDLSYNPLRSLPPEIESLRFLETLNLLNCYNLTALPDLKRMKRLRHLNNDGCRALTRMLKDDDTKQPAEESQLCNVPLFVVGGVADVVFLNKLCLRGSLKVTQLKKAETSILDLSYMRLESLGLYWESDDGCPNLDLVGASFPKRIRNRSKCKASGSSQGILTDMHLGATSMFNFFGPNDDLKTLLIKGYPYDFVHSIIPCNLKAVHLIGCRSRHLPTLGNLPFLTSVSLQEMCGVTSIGGEFYGKFIQHPFPVLKELVLDSFPNLEQWLHPQACGDAFPELTKLLLSKCPKLKVLPQFSSIKHLDVRDCGATVLCSFQNFTYLETLYIERVEDLPYFPGSFPSNCPLLSVLEIKSIPQLYFLPKELENLSTLKTLVIRWCENLCSLPETLQSLSALESLEIGDCHRLLSLPESGARGLNNLRSLSIENCNNLRDLSIGFQHLTSLETLTIMYCPRIVALPSSVEHLSSLRRLSILCCSALKRLPDELQNLIALNSLEIRSCPELKDLPEWIEKLVSLRSLSISGCHNITLLPEGVKRLTALQHLSIQDCPQLLHRCRQDVGEDWLKIQRVPHKHIESTALKRPREEGSSSLNS